MVPYPTQGHVMPMLSLARQIVSHGGIKITYVSHQTLIDRLLKSQRNLSDSIQFVGIPEWPPDGSNRPVPPIQLSLRLAHLMKPLGDKLLQDQHGLGGVTCMITDGMHPEGLDLGTKLRIPKYVFCASPALYLQVLLSSPEEGYIFHGKDAFIRVPGSPPLQVHHLPHACQYGNNGGVYLSRWRKCALETDGWLVNTCLALEAEVVDALHDFRDVPVLPVGPLGLSRGLVLGDVSVEGLQMSNEKQIIDWLSEQSPRSVLYVSFGTTGQYELGMKHMRELARGLEASGRSFLWVFRAPSGVDENDPELLPPGFEERGKDRALLVRGWAPQLRILGHPSTGAFLSGCGWNAVGIL